MVHTSIIIHLFGVFTAEVETDEELWISWADRVAAIERDFNFSKPLPE